MEINWGWVGSIEEQLNDYGCKFDEKRVKRIECLNRASMVLWLNNLISDSQWNKITNKLSKDLEKAIEKTGENNGI